MKMNDIHPKLCASVLLCLVSGDLFANQYGGSISVLTGYSDNAFKSPNVLVDERQDEYRLNLSGEYTNEHIKADADYQARALHFARDSQENQSYLEGHSSVLFGKASQPIDLLLKHSRKTLLSSPDQLNLTNNEDEREVISAIPSVRTKMGASDSLVISGNATKIRFLENDIMDSSRVSATGAWRRGISEISYIQLVAQQAEIKFENFDAADYTHRSATVIYSKQLRNLFYTIEGGYNESEPEVGEKYSSPAYNLTLGYTAGFHELTLTSSQTITDTSLGGANATSQNELPTSDGAGFVDQIERTNSELRWTTLVFCTRCNFYISLYQLDNDYLRLDQQTKVQGGGTGFSYQLSKAASLSFGLSRSSHDFADQLIGRDYELTVATAQYSYDFANQLGFKLIAQQERRDSDVTGREYKELYLGAEINYDF